MYTLGGLLARACLCLCLCLCLSQDLGPRGILTYPRMGICICISTSTCHDIDEYRYGVISCSARIKAERFELERTRTGYLSMKALEVALEVYFTAPARWLVRISKLLTLGSDAAVRIHDSGFPGFEFSPYRPPIRIAYPAATRAPTLSMEAQCCVSWYWNDSSILSAIASQLRRSRTSTSANSIPPGPPAACPRRTRHMRDAHIPPARVRICRMESLIGAGVLASNRHTIPDIDGIMAIGRLPLHDQGSFDLDNMELGMELDIDTSSTSCTSWHRANVRGIEPMFVA
ncbi:hypothetical protein DENSPDRAFT_909124 [Dentipellis sp. KUC8613]|nr:hypothetical protein DENSPDRAFT_909124 [Dentipellis sp. KUC8613]